MSSSTDRMREDFEAQFEPLDDGRFLYRRNQRGEPVPVSAQERDDFVRQYVRSIRFVLAGMTGALLLFTAVLIWVSVAAGSDLPEVPMYVGLIAITAVAVGLMYWMKGAPARSLQGRRSIGRERSREEMRAIHFQKIGYGRLAGAAALGALLIVTRSAREDTFSGWHVIWPILGGFLMLLAGVQAVRKWLFENQR